MKTEELIKGEEYQPFFFCGTLFLVAFTKVIITMFTSDFLSLKCVLEKEKKDLNNIRMHVHVYAHSKIQTHSLYCLLNK